MKKVIGWVLFALILCGGIALGICYMVMTEQTKQAMDVVISYLNTPLGIIGGTTITFGMVVFILIKAYSTYVVNKTKLEIASGKARVEELVKQAKDYEQLAKEHYDKLHEELVEIGLEEDKIYELIETICKTSPNAKIKKIGLSIKEKDNGGEERTND